MSVQKKLNARAQRRVLRVRNKQPSRGAKLRISVFRSAKQIYAQIVDDVQGKTLVSFSSLQLDAKNGDKKAVAHAVGLALGKQAQEKAVGDVFFDRGSYAYHGRVAALAEGLRESGLKF